MKTKIRIILLLTASLISAGIHAQKFEDVRAKIEMPKKATSFDGGSWKGKLDIKDKPRFKKVFSTKVLPSSLRLGL